MRSDVIAMHIGSCSGAEIGVFLGQRRLWGTATGSAVPELLEFYERQIGGIETRNREMSNKAVSMGVDRFENLLVRELIKLCD